MAEVRSRQATSSRRSQKQIAVLPHLNDDGLMVHSKFWLEAGHLIPFEILSDDEAPNEHSSDKIEQTGHSGGCPQVPLDADMTKCCDEDAFSVKHLFQDVSATKCEQSIAVERSSTNKTIVRPDDSGQSEQISEQSRSDSEPLSLIVSPLVSSIKQVYNESQNASEQLSAASTPAEILAFSIPDISDTQQLNLPISCVTF